MSDVIIDKFCQMYQALNKDNLIKLDDIYHQNIIFIDAVHQIEGIDQLHHYFRNLYQNLSACQFEIEQVISDKGQATVIWTMSFAHKKIKSGANIKVNGCSHLKFDTKIYYHRDYLDMGQMLYEHLPLLGRVVKFIKKRVSQ